MGVPVVGEIPSLTGEFVGETHRVLEHTQNQPPGNQHQKGLPCLWIVGEVTDSRLRAEQAALFPLGPSPTGSATKQQRGFPYPHEYLRLSPLQQVHQDKEI